MGERMDVWRKELKEHRKLILISLLFLIFAIILNQLAGRYVEKMGSSAVSDIILDNIPAINLRLLFIYGYTLIIAVLLLYPLVFKVKEFHIVISQFSLLVMIRSFFVSLTHLRMPTDAIIAKMPEIYQDITFNNSLFFSGHTAIPFLGFLIFRKQKLGIFFLIATIIMALTVLFMHVHYSIDVFAALFITYGSFKIGNWLFKGMNGY
jgi:hypothetical protein